MTVLRAVVALALVAAPLGAASQTPTPPAGQTPGAQQPAPPGGEPADKPEPGIPIPDKLVQDACSTCHKVDANNIMSRISFRRTTPEGWQETLRRMASLNELVIEPDEARRIVKYLADHLGLAPEEAKPGAFEVERRMIDYKYEADRDTEQTCTRCHSMGRVVLDRRTKEEWGLLLAMHRGFYPLVDSQAFRRMGRPQTEPGPDGRPPDNRHPMDKALEHLSKTFPLRTPEWAAWSATMRPPKLDGQWALSGYEPGKGAVYGQVTISAAASAPDEFTTDATYTHARSGRAVTRKGRAIVYTGFQWRGRSTEGAGDAGSLREVMFVERDWQAIAGRWFTGAYDETGLDVTLRRIGNDPIVLGVDRAALRSPSSAQRVRIHGANLPGQIAPAQIDFGQGVTVTRVASGTPGLVEVDVEVAAGARVGARDLFVAGASHQGAVVVYDKIDAIKVAPQAGLARVGGVVFPKQYQQFEATAWHYGADGKPDTKDDLNLGLVDAAWSLEEYAATFGDDDIKFVGTIDQNGLFTPNVDGPNPDRRNRTNNIGDVWVVATYTPDADAKTPLRARAQLVVSVPVYMRWYPGDAVR